MKILLIETSVAGHHKSYLQTLARHFSQTEEVHVVIPERIDELNADNIKIHLVTNGLKSKIGYIQWMCSIYTIVDEISPDIVHFLYGDGLYRFGGIGLGWLKRKTRVIVTCHQFRYSTLRNISYRMLANNSNLIVVHTSNNKRNLQRKGIRNIEQIEYPQLTTISLMPQRTALSMLDIKAKGKVILALGGTRYDKGLDILLESLKAVKTNFHLLIAGKEQYFTHDFIEHETALYREKVTEVLEFLSDELFTLCLNAADIVVLPYRKSFDGASGPLGEGVWAGKEIIGASHGSLGELIEENHLGLTFLTEDATDLTRKIREALNSDWKPDNNYFAYRKLIGPHEFVKRYDRIYRS